MSPPSAASYSRHPHEVFFRLPYTLIFLLLMGFFMGTVSCSKETGTPPLGAAETGSLETGSGKTEQEEQSGGSESENPSSSAPTPALHPSFSIGPSDLEKVTAEEPEKVQEAILARPQYFLELIKRALALPDFHLLLVDPEHTLPEGYTPDALVRLADYPLSLNRNNLTLHEACMPDLLAMNEAAGSDGVQLLLSSTYRSYEYQRGLYENYVKEHGKEEADRFSARPGTSQHQLGTAIDFGSITEKIAKTPQGKWLAEHAWEYGFSLSYPKGGEVFTGYKWEPWHFRYISRTGTRLQREFFDDTQQYMTEFLHAHADFFRDRMREPKK